MSKEKSSWPLGRGYGASDFPRITDPKVGLYPNRETVQSKTEVREALDSLYRDRDGPGEVKYVPSHDPVNHPTHYIQHPSGVECIAITEHMNFCLGNALKYLWRAGSKTEDPIQDLEKAAWYLQREITRIKASRSQVK